MRVEFNKESVSAMVMNLASIKNGEPVKSIRYIGGGGFGLVYEVAFESGKVQVMKAFKVTESMEVEAQALKELRRACPLTIPEVYYTHIADEGCSFDVIAMESIQGENAAKVKLPLLIKKRKHFTDVLINAVGKMHEYDCGSQYGFIGSNERFDSWQEFYKDFLLKVFDRAKEFFQDDSRLNRRIYGLLELGVKNIDYILSEPVEKPSLVHGDIWLPNVMVNRRTFEPVGIIDPLNAMWGDKEYDLFPLNAPVKRSLRLYQAYKDRFRTSEKVDLKVAFYALVSEVSCNIRSQERTGKMFYHYLIKRLEKQYKIHGIK